jgi:hypothetical protein
MDQHRVPTHPRRLLTRSSDPDFFAMYLVNNGMKVPVVVTIDANGLPPISTFRY